MTRADSRMIPDAHKGGWLVRRATDGLILAAAVALALPLILPFA